MSADKDQQWIFFWAAPDSDYEAILAEEREFKRKMIVRRAILSRLITDLDEETPPQAS